jgi:Xaa-Pro aminopeptidase
MFSKETYGRRRVELQNRIDGGLLLFLGNGESPMNYADNCFPFRQDSSFLYYFGLNQPDLAAVIDVDEGASVIFGDELTIDHIVWMGDLPTIAERAETVGVTTTRPRAALDEVVGSALDAGRPVRFLPPYRPDNAVLLHELLGVPLRGAVDQASLDFIRAVVDQRSIKSDEEIVELDRAVDISVEMHIAAMRMARPGMLESEIAAEVERVAVAAGGRISFPVIATIHGETLHNHFHGNALSEGGQRTIYELQLAAYETAVAMLAPGVPNRDVHFAAARVIAEGMKDLGLMKGDIDEALAAGAHAMFFPCGVGHMMGLDVHDMEDLGEVHVGYSGKAKSTQFGLKSLRLGRELEPGFVITIEPGIYFVPQLMDLWRSQNHCADFLDFDALDQWRDFGGIRNEEDFLITSDGARRLGKAKPLTVDEIEALRS